MRPDILGTCTRLYGDPFSGRRPRGQGHVEVSLSAWRVGGRRAGRRGWRSMIEDLLHWAMDITGVRDHRAPGVGGRVVAGRRTGLHVKRGHSWSRRSTRRPVDPTRTAFARQLTFTTPTKELCRCCGTGTGGTSRTARSAEFCVCGRTWSRDEQDRAGSKRDMVVVRGRKRLPERGRGRSVLAEPGVAPHYLLRWWNKRTPTPRWIRGLRGDRRDPAGSWGTGR